MVEGTPHPVWNYLALFLIDSFFFIFLAFKPYHMVNSFDLSVFIGSVWFEFANQRTCSTSIWTSSKPNLKFAQWNTLQQSQLILYWTTFCWKIVLCKKKFLTKNLCYSLQDYNNVNKKLQHFEHLFWRTPASDCF